MTVHYQAYVIARDQEAKTDHGTWQEEEEEEGTSARP